MWPLFSLESLFSLVFATVMVKVKVMMQRFAAG